MSEVERQPSVPLLPTKEHSNKPLDGTPTLLEELERRRDELPARTQDMFDGENFTWVFAVPLSLVLSMLMRKYSILSMDPLGVTQLMAGYSLAYVLSLFLARVVKGNLGLRWKRQYDRFMRQLREGRLATVLLDDQHWQAVHSQIEAEPLLHFGSPGRPKSLVARVGFASTYWRAALALADGDQRKLRAAVRSGSRSGRIDRLLYPLVAGYVLGGCLPALGLILLPLAPLLIPLFFLYINRCAAELAMLDYLIETQGGIAWGPTLETSGEDG